MAQEVLGEFGQEIKSWTLIPSSGGVHEVELDGELIFSKKELGRHPTSGEVIESIRSSLAG